MTEKFPKDDVNDAAHRMLGKGQPGDSPRDRYDHLFDPVPEVTISEEERQSWPELQDFQQKWFAPPDTAEPELYGGQKGDGGRKPTEESLVAARDRLMDASLDPLVKAIIKEHASEEMPPDEIVTLIRENPEVREELARYFLSKIRKNLLKVPERVAQNTIKNPNHTGYPRTMYSTDYAALLAISKLDGTYKQEQMPRFHLPEYDWDKRQYIRGQHQAAADFLLFDRTRPTLP